MSGVALRPYQEAGIQGLRDAIKLGARRIVLEIATGGGKTLTALAMVKAAVERGSRVLFVVNRTQLLLQTVDVFEREGLEVGVIQSTNTRDMHRRVIVASMQTLQKRMSDVPADVRLVILDEAHGSTGQMYRPVFLRTTGKASKTTVIGLTATPWASGMGREIKELEGPLFERKVCPITMPELIEQGYLVDAEIYAPPGPDMTGVRTVAGDYDEDEASERMSQSIMADIVDTWLKLSPGKKSVAFCCNIAHSQNVAAAFQRVGVDARHLDYRMKPDEKAALLGAFSRGEFTILCNPMLLREGWDCPDVETLILARPTKSLISYVQIVGRVLRIAEGKSVATVLDHSGTYHRLGSPTIDRSDEPLDTGRPGTASEAERKAKEAPIAKACSNCHYVKAAGVHKCPACGHEPIRPNTVETIDGELVLVKGKRATEKALRFGSKQEVYSMLRHAANRHGYRDGWIARKYREIFGVWPKGLSNVSKPESEALRAWILSERIRWAKSKHNEK